MLRRGRVPAGPVQTIGEAFSLADRLGLHAVAEIDGVRTVAFPAELSETPAVVDRRPPELDEHGERDPALPQPRLTETSAPARFSSCENGQPSSALLDRGVEVARPRRRRPPPRW